MKTFICHPKKINPYFKRECYVRNLCHKNIISIVDTQPDLEILEFHGKKVNMNMSYILMDFAPHGDLYHLIKDKKLPRKDRLIRTYFHQLVEGVEFLHKNGIIHFDIKLANILIGEDYQLKLADFDLCQAADDPWVVSCGSQDFRAPEVTKGERSNIYAADIYSMGIVLFAMKYRFLPYYEEFPEREGFNLQELLVNGDVKYWRAIKKLCGNNIKFGEDFKKLFISMVRKNPKERATIKDIKESPWYNGPTYSPGQLKYIMENRIYGKGAVKKLCIFFAQFK